ncbi:hypothetical protein SLS62_002708 [Diatrype stigma]|uniref:BZIP domain-containing protein n=1 Tax=Diatrype stigma TaxID=117547 RepID=A0AAN9UVW9_9PEZI
MPYKPCMMLLDNESADLNGVVLRRVATATALGDRDDGEHNVGDGGGGGGSGGGGGGSSNNNSSSSKTAAAAAASTKAQARRAQVRKAQIQHRQRKANYTKQLEMDIAKLREGIARVEGEGTALRCENDAIRQRLVLAGVAPLLLPPPTATTATNTAVPTAVVTASTGRATGTGAGATTTTITTTTSPSSSSGNNTHYTVSLGLSESNSPAYQVYRTTSATPPSGSGSVPAAAGEGFPGSSSSAAAPNPAPIITGLSDEGGGHHNSGGGGDDGSSSGGGQGFFSLTETQTDYAINFILALEHVCWDHFHPSYFAPHAHGADETAEENGHMLMASAIALQSAPASVFEHMDVVQAHVQQQQQQQQQQKQHQQSTASNFFSRAAHRRVGAGAGAGAASGASLTLENLRCLAAALNPPDVELTPVQAWFEIARERGAAVALDGALMDAVRRELALHVRCMHYGAVMPREAFDDVVGRVVGGLR